MAKKAFVYDGSQWVDIAQSTTDLSNYPTITGFSYGFRNKLINGAFDIWQRGAGAFTLSTTTYGADRFCGLRNGNVGGITSTRVDSELNGFRYANRIRRTAGDTSTATSYFGASFESNAFSIPLRGKPLVFSFYARRGSNYSGVSGTLLRLYWETGTGTDLSFPTQPTGVVATSSDFHLTTSWVRYQMVIPPVPSTTTATRYFFEWIPSGTAGANDFVDLTGMQLEEGTVATPFEQRPIGLELSLCQRYFIRLIDPPANAVGTGGTAQGISRASIYLPTEMRVYPSVSASGTFQFWNGATAANGAFANFAVTTPTAIEVEFNTNIAYPIGQSVKVYIGNNVNNFINCSAEL
jgi:hypothetical protein